MTSVYASLGVFMTAAALVTIVPGLDTALVLRTVATGGARRAALVGLGVCVGCFGWAILVALGLGALLAASRIAYTILRWVGAAYLIWVGYKMLRYPRHSLVPAGGSRNPKGADFATGLLNNLLNPKVGVFYISFLPQFVPHGFAVAPFILLLGAIHAAQGLIWFASLILATRPIARFLEKPRVVQTCDRVTGGMFVVFGVGLALESRRI